MARADAFVEPREAPCARCRRVVGVEELSLWTTRERLRTLARTSAPTSQPAAAAVKIARTPARTLALTAEPPPAPHEPAPPPSSAFRYTSRTRVDAVCPQCWSHLSRGKPLDGPERVRMLLTLTVFLAIAVLIAWGIPTFMPNLVAAFWRNGAGLGR